MRIDRTSFLALTAALAATACAARSGDADGQESAIVDPDDSNIRSPDIGVVTELKLLPNTNVPRAVLVHLASATFVADLYDHLLTINEAERLSGEDGYAQQINLIVTGTADRYAALLDLIRERRGLPQAAPVPLIDFVEDVSRDDRWLQDFGEFAAVRGDRDPGRVWYGVLDAGRGRGIDVDKLGSILGISVTKIATPRSAGTYGGNTEATADGILYLGDKVTPEYFAGLRRLGNPDAIVLPSSWLTVGHVDEYLTVVPARNACNAALVVASPIEALNMARRAPADFGTSWAEGLDAYALRPRPAGEDYALSDFDPSREPKTEPERLVHVNVQAEIHVREAVARLAAGSCVAQVVRLPQLFKIKSGKAIAATPGTPNSLILRSHAVVPDPHIDGLRDVVRRRYAEALGSEDNVHFIDDLIYHTASGEVHCGTNVIREIGTPYRM